MANWVVADIKNKFQDLEWEQRRKFLESSQNGEGAPSQWAKVSSDMVMNRNRYANVDPYANNRVRLNVPEGHSDYINASPIVLKNSKSDTQMKFIATQVCETQVRMDKPLLLTITSSRDPKQIP